MLCKEMVIHVVLALTIACAPHGEKCWQKIIVPRWAGLDLSLGTCSFSGLWPPGLWTGWTWTSAPSTPGVLRLKEHFVLRLLGFLVLWELWRSCPVAPRCLEDVICMLMKACWLLGPA